MTRDNNGYAAQIVAEGVERIFGPADPSTVFTEPIEVGNDVVVMAAAWDRAGGFGFGAGGAEGEDSGSGEGGGGGGAAEGRPVAVIRLGADGALRVEPVVDLTKIAVTAGVAVLGAWRLARRS